MPLSVCETQIKGIVLPKMKLYPFTPQPYVSGGAGDIFLNPHNRSGVSLREKLPPNANITEYYCGQELKHKK